MSEISDEHAVAHLAAVVEASEDAIISKTLDGYVLTWNRAAERIYGYSAEEAKGRPMTFLLPPDRPDDEAEILGKIRRGERVEHVETVRVRKDGQPITVSITISPIRDYAGTIVGASHIARDITQRKRIEERLRYTQHLEILGVLAAGIAHNFNNLLTPVLGNTSLALSVLPANDPNRERLREVLAAGERAADLTQQLLAYAGKGKWLVEWIDVSEAIRGIVEMMEGTIPQTVQLRVDLARELPRVKADPSQIQQLILILLTNSIEAIGKGNRGTILINTALQEIDGANRDVGLTEELAPGTYISIAVHDSGCGMDQATLSRVFDPFFTTKFLGRGLGLAAAQGIVRSHRGVLTVDSQLGAGSTFKVLLPTQQTLPSPDHSGTQ